MKMRIDHGNTLYPRETHTQTFTHLIDTELADAACWLPSFLAHFVKDNIDCHGH